MRKAEAYFAGISLPSGIAAYGVIVSVQERRGMARHLNLERREERGIASTCGISNGTALRKAFVRALCIARELGCIAVEAIAESLERLDSRSMLAEAKDVIEGFREVSISQVPPAMGGGAAKLAAEAVVEYYEAMSEQKAKSISLNEIQKMSSSSFIVSGYKVDLSRELCMCDTFRTVNSEKLIRRLGMVVRCEHILAAQKIKKHG